MMRKLLPIVVAIAFGFGATAVFAQDRGPSTPEERKRAVEIATLLENDPLNKNAKALSRELLFWLIQVPDISVTLCTSVLGDYSKIKGDHAPTIVTPLTFSRQSSSSSTRTKLMTSIKCILPESKAC